MPLDLIFHKGNALALGRVHHDGTGCALDSLGLFQGLFNLLKVVTVDGLYEESERLELGLKGCGADDLGT